MIRFFLARLFRKRYALEVALIIAISILGINEYTYRSTTSVLRSGIALTDERISAARLLQTMSDAESAQRGYLLTLDMTYLEPYKKAISDLPSLRQKMTPFFDEQNPSSSAQINQTMDLRLSEIATTISLAQSGSVLLALDIVKAGAGTKWMDSLRNSMDTELASAAARQSVTRVSIYDALGINHAAVIFLTLSSLLATYVFIRQVRLTEKERVATEGKLKVAIENRTQELRELTQYLQTVREAEKDHLARELHDQLGALLTVAKLELEGLRVRVLTTPDLTARVERVSCRINEVIVLKRRMVEDMRPSSLSMLGLRSALEQHCKDIAAAMNIAFHVNIDEVSLSPDSELVIFRFVQESLTNVAKYSQAKNVWVELTKNNLSLDLLVRDDGVGFDTSVALTGHHGLTGMRYRIDSLGGEMKINSAPGSGTAITANIPVADSPVVNIPVGNMSHALTATV